MQGKKIKSILIYKDSTITDLAAKLNKADALNCDLEINFIDRDTKKIL